MDIDNDIIVSVNKSLVNLHLGLKICSKNIFGITNKVVVTDDCKALEIELKNKDLFLSRKQTPVVKHFKCINYIDNDVYPRIKKKKLTLELIDLATKQGLILSAKNPYKIHYLSEIVNIWKNDKTLFYVSKEYRIYGSIYSIIDGLRNINLSDQEIQNVVNNLITYYNYLDYPHKDWINDDLLAKYPEYICR